MPQLTTSQRAMVQYYQRNDPDEVQGYLASIGYDPSGDALNTGGNEAYFAENGSGKADADDDGDDDDTSDDDDDSDGESSMNNAYLDAGDDTGDDTGDDIDQGDGYDPNLAGVGASDAGGGSYGGGADATDPSLYGGAAAAQALAKQGYSAKQIRAKIKAAVDKAKLAAKAATKKAASHVGYTAHQAKHGNKHAQHLAARDARRLHKENTRLHKEHKELLVSRHRTRDANASKARVIAAEQAAEAARKQRMGTNIILRQ